MVQEEEARRSGDVAPAARVGGADLVEDVAVVAKGARFERRDYRAHVVSHRPIAGDELFVPVGEDGPLERALFLGSFGGEGEEERRAAGEGLGIRLEAPRHPVE